MTIIQHDCGGFINTSKGSICPTCNEYTNATDSVIQYDPLDPVHIGRCPYLYVAIEALKKLKRRFYTDEQVANLDQFYYVGDWPHNRWTESLNAFDNRMKIAMDNAVVAAGFPSDCHCEDMVSCKYRVLSGPVKEAYHV